MECLRITLASGVRTYIPTNYVTSFVTAADVADAGSAMAGPYVRSRGRITDVKYLDGAAAANPTVVSVAAIPAYTGANTLYELGRLTDDGAFLVRASN